MEEEIRGHANSSQTGRDKTPERVIYGESKPSVTGGPGDDELLGWIQGHTFQDEGTGAVRPGRARCSSADIKICSELEEYDKYPSDTYLAPQFQESFNQVARAAMNEINRSTARTLARVALPNALIISRVARSEYLEPLYQRELHVAKRRRDLA